MPHVTPDPADTGSVLPKLSLHVSIKHQVCKSLLLPRGDRAGDHVGLVLAEDAAMRYAIGPRWAAQGPFVNLHLSGGAGGLRRVLESLGPAMQSWWRDLGHVTLTPQIIDRVVASTEDLIGPEDTGHLASR